MAPQKNHILCARTYVHFIRQSFLVPGTSEGGHCFKAGFVCALRDTVLQTLVLTSGNWKFCLLSVVSTQSPFSPHYLEMLANNHLLNTQNSLSCPSKKYHDTRRAEWIHPHFLSCVNLGHNAAVRNGVHGWVVCHVNPSLQRGCTPQTDPFLQETSVMLRTARWGRFIRTLILVEFLRNDPGRGLRDITKQETENASWTSPYGTTSPSKHTPSLYTHTHAQPFKSGTQCVKTKGAVKSPFTSLEARRGCQ